ncbi:DUF1330 domain-containing protein [Devosia rhodophyticola]|uniref:DUF1330 domain-containing protein n=1 Tax=Devosia rhodophyticola TaxID=3026423 RepID=A0ABY7YX32_9HYPH|nr:DUF1330 domain-containing protein [Devosia rhodophyticola]WDR05727.1 DUF1330 domain-containing protein [Devosia rhodophyticola]
MAKGYWIVSLDITDTEAYGAYQAFVRPFLVANEGHFIVRGGQSEVVEGSSRSRLVIVEFPSLEHARAAYHSDAYQEGMQKRLKASVADFVIAEGFDA